MQRKKKVIIVKTIGIILFILALFINPFILFHSSKTLRFIWEYFVILFFDCTLIFIGLYLYYRPNRFSSCLKKIIILIITVFVLFIITEVSLRLINPIYSSGFYLYDKDLGFMKNPQIQGNKFGLNDIDYPFEHESDVFRIVVLGDSFNWAGGYKDNYITLLEKKLNQHIFSNITSIEVINCGYECTTTDQQFALLKKYCLGYHPDLVILGFFAGNDFVDANRYIKRIGFMGDFIDIDIRKNINIFGYDIFSRSFVLKIIKRKLISLEHTLVTRKEEPLSFSKERFLELEFNKFLFNEENINFYDDNIQLIFESIGEMNNLLIERNIKFVIAMYPDEFQVNKELLKTIEEIVSKDNTRIFNYKKQQDILQKFADNNNISTIDLLPDFRLASTENNSLYIPRNTHWNNNGNALAAEILSSKLIDLKVIERD